MSKDPQLLQNLRLKVMAEIDQYVYQVPNGSIGNPWDEDKVLAQLKEMRKALVDPYWIEIELRDEFDQCDVEYAPKQSCAVVADDGRGCLLLWDPTQGEFLLAQRIDGQLASFGV